MKMTRRAGAFNIELLSAKLQERFRSLLSVAEKRTVFTWAEAPLRTAQVVFFEDHQALPAELTPGAPVFLALVGAAGEVAQVRAANKEAFHLELDFRVTQLADLLDRAAVRLLDVRGALAATPAAAAETTRVESFKLRRWMVLGPPFTTHRHMSAMALVSREAVTIDALCSHTGLAPQEARSLMAELAKHEAITSSFVEVPPAPAAAASDVASVSTVNAGNAANASRRPDGLFNKLSRWLTQSRTVQANTLR